MSTEYDGTSEYFGPVSVRTEIITDDAMNIPLTTQLNSAYPNPFNPSTIISFDIAERTSVKIDIYNCKGQKVRTLVNREFATGYHSIEWNGTDDNGKSVSTGVYLYSMSTASYTNTQKMMMLK